MDILLKFLSDNKDALDLVLKCLGFIFGSGVLFVVLRFLVSFVTRWLRERLRIEVKAFDVIADPAILLPKLYGEENNSDLLAHHRIPYQPRDLERDLQTELRSALGSNRYLLITGRAGLGKTREAATLAKSLMNEGYRVIRIKTGWLDVPKEFPSELQNDRRRILILLDDLNGLFRTGEFMQSPKAEQMLVFRQPSYHDRLLGVLDAFERMCGAKEIRVIGTARDEADEWQVLDFDPRDTLWKRFRCIELRTPSDSAIVELLDNATSRVRLRAERTDFYAIARGNDGTYANVVLNLRRAQKENKTLTISYYTATLDGSWREIYEHALEQYPAVHYIYDAIDLLRQVRGDLYPWLVEPTACLLWGGNPLQGIIHQHQVSRAIRYLVNEAKVLAKSEGKLAPRDGQIEAKGTKIDWKKYALPLHRLILRLADRYNAAIIESLLGFGATLYNAKQAELAMILMRKAIQLDPKAMSLALLGMGLGELQRSAETEITFGRTLSSIPVAHKPIASPGA